MIALLELAERCERATGPDRELDALIYIALNPGRLRMPTGEEFDPPLPGEVVCLVGFVGSVTTSPRYTASIDLALESVPEGWLLSLKQWPEPLRDERETRPNGWEKGHWRATLTEDGGEFGQVFPVGHSPALAICAAALRARWELP